jgi:hypothetical protein
MAPDWTQFLAQTRPGVVKIGPGCPFGDAEHAPDLGMFESFDVMQDDYGALPFAQCGQRLPQPTPQFIRLAGIAEWRSDRVGEGIRIADFLAPRDVERCIRDDAMQPGPEGLIRQEAVEGAIRVEEPLLNRIFRVLVGEHDGTRHRVRPPLVQPHQLRERLRFAALRRDNKRVLALAGRVVRHGAGSSRRREGIRADRKGDSGH